MGTRRYTPSHAGHVQDNAERVRGNARIHSANRTIHSGQRGADSRERGTGPRNVAQVPRTRRRFHGRGGGSAEVDADSGTRRSRGHSVPAHGTAVTPLAGWAVKHSFTVLKTRGKTTARAGMAAGSW